MRDIILRPVTRAVWTIPSGQNCENGVATSHVPGARSSIDRRRLFRVSSTLRALLGTPRSRSRADQCGRYEWAATRGPGPAQSHVPSAARASSEGFARSVANGEQMTATVIQTHGLCAIDINMLQTSRRRPIVEASTYSTSETGWQINAVAQTAQVAISRKLPVGLSRIHLTSSSFVKVFMPGLRRERRVRASIAANQSTHGDTHLMFR